MSLREIADRLAASGHPEVLKDSLWRHSRSCAAPEDGTDIRGEDGSIPVSLIVRDALHMRFHGLADRIAVDLAEHGMSREAQIVQSAACESMRTLLSAIEPTELARRLAEAEAFVVTLNKVLRRPTDGREAIAAELAHELRVAGAGDLAEAFRELADEASTADSSAGDGSSVAGSPAGPQPEQNWRDR